MFNHNTNLYKVKILDYYRTSLISKIKILKKTQKLFSIVVSLLPIANCQLLKAKSQQPIALHLNQTDLNIHFPISLKPIFLP